MTFAVTDPGPAGLPLSRAQRYPVDRATVVPFVRHMEAIRTVPAEPGATTPTAPGAPGGGAPVSLLTAQEAGMVPVPPFPPRFAEAWDPSTGRVDTVRLVALLREKSADFGEKLQGRFCRAGIDTSVPIRMTLDPDGQVKVQGEHPQKREIEDIFANDPKLRDEYADLSAGHHYRALGRIHRRFQIDWDEAKSDEERKEVWERHMNQMKRLENLAGSLMLNGGVLTSGAATYAATIDPQAFDFG